MKLTTEKETACSHCLRFIDKAVEIETPSDDPDFDVQVFYICPVCAVEVVELFGMIAKPKYETYHDVEQYYKDEK